MKHQRSSLFALAAPLLAAGVLFAACGGDDDGGGHGSNPPSLVTSSSSSSGSGGAAGGGSEGGEGGATGGGGDAGGSSEPLPGTKTLKTASGDVTWQVSFDAAAQAAGNTDCSYTRHYEGIEDQSAPWLCPTCEALFRADVQVTVGRDDCYAKISTSAPAPVEWLGYDSSGAFWRSNGAPLGAQGTATTTASALDVANTVADLPAHSAGTMSFAVAGSLSLGQVEGDPLHGWVTPPHYACGWPKADPPTYQGDYVLTAGETVPDGLVKDSCDEVVRLHDFKGSYLLIDMSAIDCQPCQQMATQEEQFVADMEAQGISVHVITLLAPSLSNVAGLTTTSMLATWIDRFHLTSPVLADRAWGLSLFTPALGAGNVGYPSWVLVDPDLKVINFGSGFGGFTETKAAILADAAP